MALPIIAITLLGLAVGSFLNVVIHRVPLRESLSRPASHCPSCGHPIRACHNVPVVSWLLLRGRCADCAVPISPRYPAVELLTAGLFTTIALQLVHLGLTPTLPAYLYFAALGVCLSVIDIDVRRLPNVLVLPAYPILAVLLSVGALLQHEPAALVRAAVGSAALFGFYFLLAFAYPAGMGFGDVKLAGLVGGMLGFLSYSALAVGAFAAFLIGAVIGVFTIVSRRGTAKTAIPFGPFMFCGALLALFASAPLADFYSRLISPA